MSHSVSCCMAYAMSVLRSGQENAMLATGSDENSDIMTELFGKLVSLHLEFLVQHILLHKASLHSSHSFLLLHSSSLIFLLLTSQSAMFMIQIKIFFTDKPGLSFRFYFHRCGIGHMHHDLFHIFVSNMVYHG